MDPCVDFSGRAHRLCAKYCDRCQGQPDKPRCQRLQQRFESLTNGAALPCAAM
jgi:hypothetical protein